MLSESFLNEGVDVESAAFFTAGADLVLEGLILGAMYSLYMKLGLKTQAC